VRHGEDLLDKLSGGDGWSIGRVEEVVAEVLAKPAPFPSRFQGMMAGDPVIRLRAVDAVEKVTADRPELLRPYEAALLGRVDRIEQQEVRWHVAQMLPRLDLGAGERDVAVAILTGYLQNRSKTIQKPAMQALAGLAETDVRLCSQVLFLLEESTATGSPAMQTWGRKLLQKLGASPEEMG
jgi:hypothetical protein